ncbi:FtsK/SpoIIIE domain-containing protein [Micromonospora sp. NPDC049559]|uniref:FtsK/SpoIIIE domain-containing protein n=1 Tax=Micromonospora sp. NPDC049559 TaxID=3155923 RepID=UPI00343EDEDA
MGRLAATFGRAVAAHREALAQLAAARAALGGPGGDAPDRSGPVPAPGASRDTVLRLRRLGAALATGWLGGDGSADTEPDRPLGTEPVRGRRAVRIGLAGTTEGPFPALVPLAGGAHLAIDTDARDPRVAGLLRRLTVRLLAAAPAGTLRVQPLDPVALGGTFLPLRPLIAAGVVAEPASSDEEIGAALGAAEEHARAAQEAGGEPAELLLLVAAAPPAGRDLARLAALTHAGPAAGICVVVAGYPPAGPPAPPPLGAATQLRLDPAYAWLGDPPGDTYGDDGGGLAAPVRLDGEPADELVRRLAAELGESARRAAALAFADLLPATRWTESSVDGLRTVVGRAGRESLALAFDDATPHWLVGGRTGAGKTVFLLDVLYGLAARYSPDELALYLLDFKEGVSFTEFVPTGRDPSWIPHARAVGIESDREYGVAVLRELRRELNRRAAALKRAGVTKLADLRRGGHDTALPRVVAVIDEFHVLFTGNDAVAREAATLLEELARKGRSYGIHLVLASQSMSGIEALYGKTDSIFGQFPLRVALPGGNGVLDKLNEAAGALPLGSAIVNPSAGLAGANTVIRFPDAHADGGRVGELRHELWQARVPGSRPPAIFKGYESTHVESDPTYAGLRPGGRRPLALVGRVVDVHLSTAYFPLDATPGRHLAVVGTGPAGADVLQAAALGLGRQHEPGTASFLLAPLVAGADEVAEETAAALARAGHPVVQLDAAGLRQRLGEYAAAPGAPGSGRTYLVVFGMDGAAATLGLSDPTTFKSGLDDLRAVLRQGPGYGVHLLGWWRGLRRLADDLGGSHNRDDMACLVALNVPGNELGMYLGGPDLAYTPRANRALLIDRHDQRNQLIVPYLRPGRELDEGY